MTEHAQAVPLARKKRRRPPSKAFVWVATNIVWCVAWMLFDLTRILLGVAGTMTYISAGIIGACLAYWWPVFLREYRAWKDSE